MANAEQLKNREILSKYYSWGPYYYEADEARGRRRAGPTEAATHAAIFRPVPDQQYDKQPMAETMADTAPASAQRHSNSVPG